MRFSVELEWWNNVTTWDNWNSINQQIQESYLKIQEELNEEDDENEEIIVKTNKTSS